MTVLPPRALLSAHVAFFLAGVAWLLAAPLAQAQAPGAPLSPAVSNASDQAARYSASRVAGHSAGYGAGYRAARRSGYAQQVRLESGRYRFLAATTLIGVAEGALLSVAAGADEDDDGDAVAAAVLLGGTTGFFVPLLLTRNAGVTEAEATLTGYGGAQGLLHGVLLSTLIGTDDFLDEGSAAALTAALVGAEATAGFLFARQHALRGGVAETMALGGGFGTGLGLGTAVLILGGDDTSDAADRALAFGGLAGSVLGAYGGHRLGRYAGYTQGDARIFGTAGLVGAQLASALLVSGDADDARTIVGSLMAGGVGGLALGHRLVQGRDFAEGQGNIISLGAYAGSLAGLAISIIADADGDSVPIYTSVGALGGFLGTYFTYRGEARVGGEALSMDVGLAPGHALPDGAGGPMGRFTPAVNVRLAF